MTYPLTPLPWHTPCIRILMILTMWIMAVTAWSQDPEWDEVVTICHDTYILEADISSSGTGGEGWQLLGGSGSFDPLDTRITTVTGIGMGENRYWYDGPGNHDYYIMVIRVEPPVFTLTAPETFCGSDDIITLTLSGSDSDYHYNLYRNGALFIEGTPGTGDPLTWIVDEPGTFTAEAVLNMANSDCRVWMNGEVDVIIAPLPQVYQLIAPHGNDMCEGSQATLTLDGSDPGISYQLYLGNEAYGTARGGTGDPVSWSVSEAGSYHVVAVDNMTGCTETMEGTVSLTELQSPQSWPLSPSSASYCGGAGGSVTLTLGGSQTDVSYQLLRYGNPVDGSLLAGTGGPLEWDVSLYGPYTVIATDDINNCQSQMDNAAVVSRLTKYSVGSSASYYCEGEGGVDITLGGSQSGVTYRLYRDGHFNSSKPGTGNPLTWENMKAGTYLVYARKDGIDCLMGETTVSVITFDANLLDPVDAICQGDQAQLNATGGEHYLWEPSESLSNNTIADPVATPSVTTEYTVTITDEYGCQASRSVTVTVHSVPVANAGSNRTICFGESVRLNATGGTTYHWSPAEGLSATDIPDPEASPVSTTQYTVAVFNDQGCMSTDKVTVTVNPVPTVNAGPDVSICEGEGTTLEVTGDAGSYEWSTGETTGSIAVSPLSTSVYRVTGTYTDTGCSASDEVRVEVSPLPMEFAVTGGGSFCEGTGGLPVGLNGSEPGVNYSLYRNGEYSGPTIAGDGNAISFGNKDMEGIYTVSAMNTASACTYQMAGHAELVKNRLPGPAQSVTGSNPVCPGSTVEYSVAEIARAESYRWDLPPNATITAGNGTRNITVYYPANAVSGTISVRGVNDCGEGTSSGADITVRLLPEPAGVITGETVVCEGTFNIKYTIEPVANATSYQWELPPGAILYSTSVDETQIIADYPGGSITGDITVTPVNSCGMGEQASLAITVNPVPNLTLSEPADELDCSDNRVTLSASSSTPGVSWSWTAHNGGNITGGAGTNQPEVNMPGTYRVSATAGGCSAHGEIRVTRNTEAPEDVKITRSGDRITCNDPLMTLTASTTSTFEVTYSWSASGGGNIVSGENSATPVIDRGGYYTVVATSSETSCMASPVTILIDEDTVSPDLSDMDLLVSGDISCLNSQVQLSADPPLSGSFVWSSDDGNIDNPLSPSPYADSPGIYTVTVTGDNGCSAEKAVQVFSDYRAPENIWVNMNPGTLNCLDDEVVLEGSSTTEGAQYQWTGPGIVSGETTATPVVNLPGEYTMTVTHPESGCTGEAPVTVEEDLASPSVSFPSLPGTITCNNPSIQLESHTSAADPLYEWFDNNNNLIEGQTTGTLTVTTGGTYTLRVTDQANHCRAESSITVKEDTTPPGASITAPAAITCNDPEITLHGSSPAGGVTPLWTTTGGNIVTGSTSFNPSVNSAGSYLLTVTDPGNGCSSEALVIVQEDKEPPVIVNFTTAPSPLSCINNLTELTGNAANATLLWSGPEGAAISDPSAPATYADTPGIYRLTATNTGNGCEAYREAEVTMVEDIPEGLEILPFENLSCARETTTLTATSSTAGTTFRWEAGEEGTILSDPGHETVTIGSAGTYTVYAAHPVTGCETESTAEAGFLSAAPTINLPAGLPEKITCNNLLTGVQLSATVEPAGAALLWEGPGTIDNHTTDSPTVYEPGLYTITAAHPETGCTSFKTLEVKSNMVSPEIISFNGPGTVTCAEPGITISPELSEGSFSYRWAEASADATIKGSETNKAVVVTSGGIYTLTVTDLVNGCETSKSVAIDEDKVKPGISVDDNPPDITCKNSLSGLYGTSATSGVAYLWDGPGNIINPATETPTVDQPGTYTLTVTDMANGCISTASVTVGENKVPPPAPAVLDPEELSCNNEWTELQVSPYIEGVDYHWSANGTGTIINGNTDVAAVNSPGTYTVTVTDRINGCTSSAEVTVSMNEEVPDVAITGGPYMITCATTSLTITGSSPDGANPVWTTDGGNIISDRYQMDIEVDAPGEYTLTVRHPVSGCPSSATVTAGHTEEVPLIDVDSYPQKITCGNGTVQLYGAPADLSHSFEWSTENGNIVSGSDGFEPVVDRAGTYLITVTDPVTGCSNQAGITVEEDMAAPEFTIADPGQFTCETGYVQLKATVTSGETDVDYAWTTGGGGTIWPGDENVANPRVTTTGTYTLTVTNNTNLCTTTKDVTVSENTVPPNVSADKNPDKLTCERTEVILSGNSNTGGATFKWSSADGHPVYNSTTRHPRVTMPGTYILTVTDPANGCTAQTEVTVISDTEAPHVHIEPGPGILTCSVTSVMLEGSSNTAGVSYRWTGPVLVESPGNKVVYVSEPGRYYLTVTRNSTGCTSTAYIDIIQDTEVPAPPSADDAIACFGGDPVTLAATGSNIRWYDHSNLSDGALIKEDDTYTPAENGAGNHYYYVTQTSANGCESPAIQVRYTIRELPTAPATVSGEVCEGSPNPRLRAIGSNISWYGDHGGPVLATGEYYTPDPSVNAPGKYTFYASRTDEHGCESDLTPATLTIREIPAVPVISEALLETCAGEPNPPFSATGKNIRWYGSATATNHLYSGNEYTSTKVNPGSYDYFVSQTSDHGCESDRAAASLVIVDNPSRFDVTGGGTFCENASGVSVGLDSSEAGVEYTLWLDGSTIMGDITGTGAEIDFGLQDTEGTYTITATGNNGCSTPMNGAVSVLVNLLPATPGVISGQDYVCQGSSDVLYEIDPVAGATHYHWEVPAGSVISSGNGTRSIRVDFSAAAESGAIRVRAVNSCGNGPVSGDYLVNVDKLPAPAGNITATPFNSEVCRGDQEVVFEVPVIDHATSYEWFLPAGATILQGAGTRTVKVGFSSEAATGNQEVRVRGVNGCGQGELSAPHTVAVYAPPAVSAGADQHLCSDNTALQGSPVPGGGTARWETVAGYAVFSSNNIPDPGISSLAMGENIFTYTVTLEACSVTDTVRIFNNQVLVDAGSDRVICSEEITLQGSAVPENATGLWTAVTGSASFSDASRSNSKAGNFDYGDNRLRWTITKNGCKSSDEVTITNHRPPMANAGNDITTCNSEAYLDASHPSQGEGEWQVISGKAVFDNPSDPQTRAQSLDRGMNRIAWVVSNHGCTLGDTITITNIDIDISAGENQELCDSRTTLDGTVPPEGSTGEWSVARGAATFMDRNAHDTRVSGLASGTNEVVWTITRNGCRFSDTVILTNNMPTQANAGPDQEVTVNHAQLEANNPAIGTGIWSVMNGSGIFSDPAGNTATVTELSPGPNTFRWTITHNGCESTSDVTINNGSLESIYAGEDQQLCSDATMLEATEPPFGFGVWTIRQGTARFENNEQADTRVYDLGRGENILRWSVTIGSTEYYDEVTITNNMPTVANAGTGRSLCSSSFTLAGNEPLTGSGRWTIEGGSAVIDDQSLHNSPVYDLAQGSNLFRWTITNANCVSSDIVVISNDIPTTPDAGEDISSCDGTAELFPNTPTIGTGGWSVISGSGSFDGNSVSNLANGENRLLYTIRNNQCELSDEVVVTSYKPTIADAGYNMNVCVDSVDLNANQPNQSIGETGRWTVISGSGRFEDPGRANTTVHDLAPGRNVFRWTVDNQGCTSYDEIEVSYDHIPAHAGYDITTCDSEVTLNANNPGNGAGEWTIRGGSGSAVFESPNSPNTHVSGLDRGNNILRWTITNNRCVSFDEITVRNSSPSNAWAGSDQIICTDSVQLSARNPVTGQGTWSVINGSGRFDDDSQYNTAVRGVGPGANTFRWTVEHEGCTSTDEVVIRNNKPLDTYAGNDQVLCDDTAILTANQPEQGTGVWSIVQGAGVIEDAYSNETVVNALAPDENILRWTVTNGQCSDYSDIRIVNNKPATALAGADRVICSDKTVLEGNIPLEGTGRWSVISGSGFFEDAAAHNSEVTRLSRGRNILRWTITKENCASISDVIIQNDMPSIPNAGADIAVCGNSTPLNGNMPAVGTGRWSLVSGSGSFDDPARSNTSVTGLGQGVNVLRWTITNNECSLSDEAEVRNNTTDVYAGPDQLVYEDAATLSGNTPARGNGLWSVDAGGGSINDPSSPETRVEGIKEGVNTFVWAVDIDGCISSDEVRITYYRQPVSSFSVSHTGGCPPLQVRFTKTTTGNYPFRWYLGEEGSGTLEENPVYTYDEPGRYAARLYITGADGQEVVSERIITVHEPPAASFELAPAELYIPGNELRTYNYSYNSEYYLWDFGDGNTSDEVNPVHMYENEGSFDVSLKVWSAEGCTDSLTYGMPVTVTQTTRVRFPSAFTPNEAGGSGGRYDRNDFSNQVFYPVMINGNIDNYRLEIFNRWGVKLFESDDIEVGWDGYYRGQLVAEDIYIFRVTGRLNSGEKFTETGDFLLMRRD